MKKMNNKGFSLVELIVVVAIMAVLIGILAPTYLSYVEKTKQGKDKNTAAEIEGAVEKAIAGELEIYDKVMKVFDKTDNTLVLTWTLGTSEFNAPAYTKGANKDGATAVGSRITELDDQLKSVFGDGKIEAESKKYAGGTIKVWITFTGADSPMKVEHEINVKSE